MGTWGLLSSLVMKFLVLLSLLAAGQTAPLPEADPQLLHAVAHHPLSYSHHPLTSYAHHVASPALAQPLLTYSHHVPVQTLVHTAPVVQHVGYKVHHQVHHVPQVTVQKHVTQHTTHHVINHAPVVGAISAGHLVAPVQAVAAAPAPLSDEGVISA